MTDVEATYEGFMVSRRTGRRNAVHDLPPADPGEQGPADLAQGLAQLNVNKSGNEGEGLEKIQDSSDKEQESQS